MPRPRRPDSIRRLEGESRNSRLRGNEEVIEVAAPPSPPASVVKHDRALEIWECLAPALVEAGVLTVLDEQLFGALCSCLAFCDEAQDHLMGEGILVEQAVGNGGRRVVKHPAAQVYRDMLQSAQRLASDFGITHRSREALGIRIGQGGDDILDRIING